MHFTSTVLATGACVLQFCSMTQALSFTNWPSVVKPGESTTVKWSEAGTSPVKISLCQGESTDLKVLKVIAAGADGPTGSFTWIPDESLKDGSDYALTIEQDGIKNYSGHLKVTHDSSGVPLGKGPKPSASSTAFGTAPRETDTQVAKGNTADNDNDNDHDHDRPSDPRVISGKTALSHSEEQTAGASSYGVPLRLALGSVAVFFYFTT